MGHIHGLAEIVLWVHDLAASVRFYSEMLELPIISPPERVNPTFLKAGAGVDGIPSMVVLVQMAVENRGVPFALPRQLHHLALTVAADEFDALRRRLEDHCLSVRTGQHPIISSRTMYVDDPDGNEVEFICPA